MIDHDIHEIQEVLKKCKNCENHTKINQLMETIGEHEGRLNEGEDRFMRIETSIRENTRITEEVHEVINNLNETMYMDKPDQRSIQSTLIELHDGMKITNSKVVDVRAFIVFIGISLDGITFFLIQKSLDTPSQPAPPRTPDHQIILPYTRDQTSLEEWIKNTKEK